MSKSIGALKYVCDKISSLQEVPLGSKSIFYHKIYPFGKIYHNIAVGPVCDKWLIFVIDLLICV